MKSLTVFWSSNAPDILVSGLKFYFFFFHQNHRLKNWHVHRSPRTAQTVAGFSRTCAAVHLRHLDSKRDSVRVLLAIHEEWLKKSTKTLDRNIITCISRTRRGYSQRQKSYLNLKIFENFWEVLENFSKSFFENFSKHFRNNSSSILVALRGTREEINQCSRNK